MSRLIFLIGMPGAGKSFWGRTWAHANGWQHADMDEQIQAAQGMTISDLFAQQGEAYFRRLEQETLQQIIDTASGDTLISCGGGTPVFHNNLALMRSAGCILYLQASIADLVRNLEQDAVRRPLLQALNVEALLKALLAARAPFYEQAHHIVPVRSITDTTFAEILTVCTNRHS